MWLLSVRNKKSEVFVLAKLLPTWGSARGTPNVIHNSWRCPSITGYLQLSMTTHDFANRRNVTCCGSTGSSCLLVVQFGKPFPIALWNRNQDLRKVSVVWMHYPFNKLAFFFALNFSVRSKKQVWLLRKVNLFLNANGKNKTAIFPGSKRSCHVPA